MSEAVLLPWFSTADDTPPEWAASHPPGVTSNAATTYDRRPNPGGVTLRMTAALSEPGRVFFAAFAAAAATGSVVPPPPPPSAIRACVVNRLTSGGGGAAAATAAVAAATLAAGATEAPVACAGATVDVPGVDGAVVVDIDGLDSETRFVVYAAAEDLEDLRPPHPPLSFASPRSNLQREATLATPRDGVMTADITPPRWHGGGGVGGGEPTAIAATSNDFTVSFGISEPGEVFWVVVPEVEGGTAAAAARSAPTAAEVTAGTGPGGGGHVASGIATVTATAATSSVTLRIPSDGGGGLTPRVSYVAYFTARDVFRNAMVDAAPVPEDTADDAVATVRVTTRDDAPPVFRDGSPSVLVGGRVAQVTAAANEPGRVFFVVVAADDAPPPSSEEVRAGTAAGGAAPLAASDAADATTCGFDGGDRPLPCLASCGGSPGAGCLLADGADYDAYVVAEVRKNKKTKKQTGPGGTGRGGVVSGLFRGIFPRWTGRKWK